MPQYLVDEWPTFPETPEEALDRLVEDTRLNASTSPRRDDAATWEALAHWCQHLTVAERTPGYVTWKAYDERGQFRAEISAMRVEHGRWLIGTMNWFVPD